MVKRVSLVVGGTGGIGFASAEKLYEKGNSVCIWGRKKNQLEKNLGIGKKKYGFYEVNLFDEHSIKKNLKKVIEDYGRINSVVYSVSIPIKHRNIGALEWSDFQDHLDIQVKALFLLVKIISENFDGGGKLKFIILLTEYCFGKPPSRIAHYITSKYALQGFVKAMASELDPNKYTFNMISPGMVNTELISNLPERLVEMTAQKNPMGRISEPTDIAKVVSFLDSEDSDYLNGINIVVNGGNVFS